MTAPKLSRPGIAKGSSIIPIKVYQDIYHQITGRTEQIKKTYDESLLIGMQEYSSYITRSFSFVIFIEL